MPRVRRSGRAEVWQQSPSDAQNLMDTLKHFENECQNRQTHCMSKIKKARSRFRRVSCRHAVRGFLLPGIALGAEEYKPVAICQRRSQNPGPTPPCLRARPQCDNSYTPAVLAPCSRTPSAGRVRRCCRRTCAQTRAGRRVIFNRFWQLNDVAGQLGMDDTAIMRRTQPTSILWLGTLRSSKRGSHRFRAPRNWG